MAIPVPEYLPRTVDAELDELLAGLPAVALEGPKAVGKTATAQRRAATIFHLDDAAQREVVRADLGRLTEANPPILIDEWQRVPESWDVVRRSVDSGAAPGTFLLTGSASGAGLPTHSGAGRIVTLRMRPLSLAERQLSPPMVSLRSLLEGGRPPLSGQTHVRLETYAQEIVGSGFPGLRFLAGRALRAQLDGYLLRIVDRDFEELGRTVRKPAALRAWMSAYAAATATTASYETIRDAATSGHDEKPSKSTTIPYREALERLWIVDPVPAWTPSRNPIARVASPPKHHLADPALAARLLGVGVEGLLDGRSPRASEPRHGSLLGRLFESLVTLSVRAYAQAAETRVGHVRTWRGDHEIDLVVIRPDDRVVAIEVKLAQVPNEADFRQLRWMRDEIGPDLLDAVVITTGSEAYRRRDGIGVIPAALLGP